MRSSPAFQFYPSDFLAGTAWMTSEQVGAYIRLLCYQWQQGSLPNDPEKLARMAGCSLETINLVVCKFPESGGVLRNKRLELVRENQQKWRESRTVNGKKGGRPRGKTGRISREEKPSGNLVVCNEQDCAKPYAKLSKIEIESKNKMERTLHTGDSTGTIAREAPNGSIFHQITSQIGDCYRDATGAELHFDKKWCRPLQKFLLTFKGTADDWLGTFHEVLLRVQDPLCPGPIKAAADPAALCNDWSRVVALMQRAPAPQRPIFRSNEP